MRPVSIVLLALLACAAVAHADMVVPVTFALNCSASYQGYNDYYPITSSGVNHASVTINPGFSYATIDCVSGTTDPAMITGDAWGVGGFASAGAGGPMTFGTAPSLPAGTPLTLHIQVDVGGNMGWDSDLILTRGTTTVLNLHMNSDPSYDRDISILAGETLNLSYAFGIGVGNGPQKPRIWFQTMPEPTAFILLLLPTLLRRR